MALVEGTLEPFEAEALVRDLGALQVRDGARDGEKSGEKSYATQRAWLTTHRLLLEDGSAVRLCDVERVYALHV